MTTESNDTREIFFPIADLDEWQAFYAENKDAIECDAETAFALACNQSLIIGGGAAPIFRVGFID